MIIYTVAHKKFELPHSNIYKAIMVGAGTMNDSIKDSSGDNISHMNKSFCELTALYWIWKNSNQKIIGLVHYRRYFRKKFWQSHPIDENDIKSILKENDFIVSKKRDYYIMNVRTHYKKSHYIDDLNLVRDIILTKHNSYLSSFDKIMSGRKISLYNMFITKKEYLDDYCEWLFPILFELDSKIDLEKYDVYQKRVIGFLAERLFNVWLMKNSDLKIKELSVFNTEGNQWIKKIYNFIIKAVK